MIDVYDEDAVAGDAPLLLSEVDAALSGETSLDHESAARVGGDRPHDGHVDRSARFFGAHVLNTCLQLGFRADLADPEEVPLL